MKTEIFASVQPNQRPPLDTRAPAEHVLEIVTPRTNVARLSSAEHLFGALVAQSQQRPEPVSLEIVGDSERRRFLVRTPTGHGLGRVAEQLGASYPQAVLRGFQSTSFPRGDPLQVGPDEQVVAARLKPRQGEHLPLRTFEDRELEVRGDSFQVDPLLGILSALSDLPAGWRAVCQLIVLANAPQDWARAHQRLALERPLERERHIDTGPSPVGPLAVLALIGIVLVALSVTDTWSRGDWLPGLELASGVLAATVLCVLILRWLGKHDLVEPRLVQQKLSRDACLVELRLAVIAPLFADSDALDDRLRRLVAAYRPFALATGNSLIARTLADENDLRTLASSSRPSLLNVRELAGLWHLPQSGDDIAFVERTTARRRLPLAHTVAPTADGSGCHIGVSAHQNHTVPVYLPTQLLRRHLLAVAKTRRGKSSLLLQMVHHLMQAEDDRRSVVLVDPHRDLAVFALGLVPRAREADVVYLDVSNRRRPFGINLLDTGLGWDRDQASVNVLRIFRREFDGYWGPRMEDAFRFATLALYEANEALCADDPLRGRGAQHTILDVPALLERPGFRRQVLKKTSDPFIRQWFDGYFEPLDRRYQLEIINPVQTKVHKYLGSRVARHIVGQPRSTIDFRELVGTGKIIIINLNAFDVGEDLAALIGGSLFNLAARAVSSQALSAAADRRPVTLVVDEFHTLPGADYEQVLGELAKYGANVMLASQTLSRLDRLTDAQRTRNLRASVFSNLDGLFAFHTSAEDAAYLAEELGGGLDAQDLLELGHFQWCAA
ncbi:MAG: type IV secretory system conjugative DNA transfer family protein [Chloroflexi bacterium]|nr:type IV secretory system conjugative DNA transfer family protein [Chloroflexota bacterium]